MMYRELQPTLILRKKCHKNPPSYLNRIYSSTCVKKELSVVCKVSLKILIILNGSNYSERMKDFHFEKLPGSKCVVYMYYTSPFRVWIGKKPGSFCWNRPNFSYPNLTWEIILFMYIVSWQREGIYSAEILRNWAKKDKTM